jgi:methyl-accepting chemotaxis protein
LSGSQTKAPGFAGGYLLGIIILGIGIPSLLKKNAVDDATGAAQKTVAQFKTLRKYYVSNVINKIKGSPVKASHLHKGVEGTIPVPATLIHDMSKLLVDQGTAMTLYSAYPFPNRSKRQLDDFGKDAWKYLNENPDKVFVETADIDEKEVVRVAVADRMVAQGCVDCHNSHPDTPRKGWKMGDVRGVLQIDTVIDEQVSNGFITAMEIIGALLLMVAVACWMMWSVTRRELQGPVKSLLTFAHSIATGDLEAKVDDRYDNELDELTDSLTEMRDALKQQIDDALVKAKQTEDVVDETRRVFAALSKGDLSQTMGAEFEATFSVLTHDANETVAMLSQVIEHDIQSIVESAQRGELDQRIDLSGKSGFFLSLSDGINNLVESTENIISDTARVLSAMAQGDLTERIDASYQGIYDKLKADANATNDRLIEVVGEIKQATYAVKTGTAEIASGNVNLSQRTENQAASLEQTSSAMEEMTATVQQNAGNARQADTLAQNAGATARSGGEEVNDAIRAMAEISESSNKITDIIGAIDEIAFQTNLLALNASVEAARAGDQGRGFAVVASEVRNLAGRSATAAKEIKVLIEDSSGKVDEGTKLVNKSGETLEEIVTSVKKVTDIVAEIAAASAEQAAGLDEVNKAVVQMDGMTQQNAALVEEAAAASESLGEQADSLDQLITFFNTGGGTGNW